MKSLLKLVACAGALALFSCKGAASEAEIERMKAAGRQAQIAEAMISPKSSPAVRAKAAKALIELAADAHFADALKKLDAQTREELAKAIGPELDQLFAAKDLARQVLAKDFLGLLILAGERHTAERAGPVLVRWLLTDFSKRKMLGKVSGAEVLKRIGAPALASLHRALASKDPGADLLLIAKTVQGIGDANGIAIAADHVFAIAKSQAPKVNKATLQALFSLGGPRAAQHLVALAGDASFGYPTRREAAEELRALGHGAAREAAAKLALDGEGDQLVRESVLVYLEKVCDAKACGSYLPGLWKALGNASLVFESSSAIVKIGGAAALPELLRKLPVGRGYTAKAIEGLADDIARNIGAAALPALRAGAKERKGPGRILAFRGLAKLGDASDAALLEKMKGEDEVPEGWRLKSSLGTEAARAAADIKKRKP